MNECKSCNKLTKNKSFCNKKCQYKYLETNNPAQKPEIAAKISKALKGKFVGKNNPFYGKVHSKEFIQKQKNGIYKNCLYCNKKIYVSKLSKRLFCNKKCYLNSDYHSQFMKLYIKTNKHKENLAISTTNAWVNGKMKGVSQKVKDTNLKRNNYKTSPKKRIATMIKRYGRIIARQKGYTQTEETKKKISKTLMGRKQSKELIQKRTQIRKDNNYKHTEETKKKIGLANTNPSLEIRKRKRLAAIKRIEKQGLNGLPLTPCIGKYETQILDYLEDKIGDKIIRQYLVCGYFLDGYSKLRNIAFEIDEPYHFTEEKQVKDKIRQLEIEEELKCQFVRIKVPN